MSTLIVLAGFLVLVHFVYDGILAPTFRLKQRHKLFILRDSLHKVKLEKLSIDEQKLVKMLDIIIENSLKRMNEINLYNTVKMREYASNDESFQKEIKKYDDLIKSIHNKGLINIDKKLNQITLSILVINMGGVVMVILPIYLIIKIFGIFKPIADYTNKIIQVIKRTIEGFILIPDHQYQRGHFYS